MFFSKISIVSFGKLLLASRACHLETKKCKKINLTYAVWRPLPKNEFKPSNAMALSNMLPSLKGPLGWNCSISDSKRVRDC